MQQLGFNKLAAFLIKDHGLTPGHFAPKMARLIQKNAITRLRS
jgi:hypothetical protein